MSSAGPPPKGLPPRRVALGSDRGEHRPGPRGRTRSGDPARGGPGRRSVAFGRLPPLRRPRGAAGRGVKLCAQRARGADAPTRQSLQRPSQEAARGRRRVHRLRDFRAWTVSRRIHLASRDIPDAERDRATTGPDPFEVLGQVLDEAQAAGLLDARRRPGPRWPPGQRCTAWPACYWMDRCPGAPPPSDSRRPRCSISSNAVC